MDEKDKIRERYKGVNNNKTFVIPAKSQSSIYDDTIKRRVAVYARVSTDSIGQTSSFELQRNHYTDLINKNPNWTLVDIYADEGISGTSLNNRNEFLRMIDDCKAGKIDLIITKTVARFARNTVDCMATIQELKNLTPPVYILFESECVNTYEDKNEMPLTFLAAMAQEESHIKSNIMNSSIDMRFNRGLYLISPLLGYDLDENKNLVINPEEAKTVKLIFYMYLSGSTPEQIAETLEEYGRKTKKGNTKWSSGSILQILQNERECGDLLSRKTWTPSYLNHKSKKNKGDKTQYGMIEHHKGIISRDDFIAVQKLIRNAKYKHKGFLPELKVIRNGILQGFVTINIRWSGFSAQNYIDASKSAYNSEGLIDDVEIKVQEGDFDLRNFEVARAQFFDTAQKTCVTFSNHLITFNIECIRKFGNIQFVEMLINPVKKLFAVRPCKSNYGNKNIVQWAKIKNGVYISRNIHGMAYAKTLFEILGWDSQYKYRVRGVKRQKEDEQLIIFDLTEPELFISQEKNCTSKKILEDIEPFTYGKNNNILAYPNNWDKNFGNNFYQQIQTKILENIDNWNSQEEGNIYKTHTLQVTSADDINAAIKTLKTDMEHTKDDK